MVEQEAGTTSNNILKLDATHQHINLLDALPREERLYLPAKKALKLLGLLILVLLLLHVFFYFRHYQLSKQVVKLNHQKAFIIQKVLQGTKNLKGDSLFIREQKALNARIKAKETVLAAFKKVDEIKFKGYSNYLIELAKLIQPDTWLSAIDISRNGIQVFLSGQSFLMSDILSLRQTLNHFKVFKDFPFVLTKLQKEQEKASKKVIYEFNLRTKEVAKREV